MACLPDGQEHSPIRTSSRPRTPRALQPETLRPRSTHQYVGTGPRTSQRQLVRRPAVLTCFTKHHSLKRAREKPSHKAPSTNCREITENMQMKRPNFLFKLCLHFYLRSFSCAFTPYVSNTIHIF